MKGLSWILLIWGGIFFIRFVYWFWETYVNPDDKDSYFGLNDIEENTEEKTVESEVKIKSGDEMVQFNNQNYEKEAIEDMNRDKIMKSLQRLGCQPTVDDNKNIGVSFQGENFLIDFYSVMARIWDPGWSKIDKNDARIDLVREYVNYANFEWGPKILMTTPDKDGDIIFHTRFDFKISPTDSDYETDTFLQNILLTFFDIKRTLHEKLHKRINGDNSIHEESEINLGTQELNTKKGNINLN